jgi:hypothetical protein
VLNVQLKTWTPLSLLLNVESCDPWSGMTLPSASTAVAVEVADGHSVGGHAGAGTDGCQECRDDPVFQRFQGESRPTTRLARGRMAQCLGELAQPAKQHAHDSWA